jgi:hypothetical protein
VGLQPAYEWDQDDGNASPSSFGRRIESLYVVCNGSELAALEAV